jgi:hypothetical protein
MLIRVVNGSNVDRPASQKNIVWSDMHLVLKELNDFFESVPTISYSMSSILFFFEEFYNLSRANGMKFN